MPQDQHHGDAAGAASAIARMIDAASAFGAAPTVMPDPPPTATPDPAPPAANVDPAPPAANVNADLTPPTVTPDPAPPTVTAGEAPARPERRRTAAASTSGAEMALAAALASRDVLGAFVAEAGRLLDLCLLDLWVFDREREVVRYEAAWRHDGASAAELAAVGTVVPLAARPDLALLLERRAPLERHVDDPDLPAEARALMERRGYRSSFDLPLFEDGEVVGVLGLVERRAVRRFDDEEQALLDMVCRLAEVGVWTVRSRRDRDDHAGLLQRLVDSSHALAATFDQRQVVERLRRAASELLPGIEHDVGVWLRGDDDTFARLDDDRDDAEAGRGGAGAGEPAPDKLVLRAVERHRPAQARTSGEPTRLIVPLVVPSRTVGYLDITGRPLRRFSSAETAVLQALGDLAAVAFEHRRLERAYDRQAAVDPVTGFFSRWYFYDHLYSETARAGRYKQPLSVVLVGVDGFERLVIGRGRPVGDAVLKAIARLLLAGLRRKVDVACVHGAGEFALLLPSTPPSRSGAALVARRLREAIAGVELRDEDHGLLGSFTLSVGVAGYPRHAEDADELGGYAVEALAKARALGGDRVQVYGEASDGADDGRSATPSDEPADALSGIILPPDWDDAPDEDR